MTDTFPLLLDTSAFPIVRVRMEGQPAGYTRQWVAEMDAILARGEPFALVALDQHGEESAEDKKTKALWIKAKKEEFARLCRAFVMVEPNVVKRVALRAQGAVVAAAFGLSFFAVADAAEAESLARRRLGGDTAAHAAD